MARAIVSFMALALAAALPATADTRTGLGDLICTLAAKPEQKPADFAGSAGAREMLCTFRNGDTGTEETYRGKLKVFTEDGDFKQESLLWIVSISSGVHPGVGFLEQSYSSDIESGPDSVAPLLIGDADSSISLKLMLERPPNAPLVRVASVELALMSAGA